MNPPKQKGLGRGLDALLAANNSPESSRQDSLPVGALQPVDLPAAACNCPTASWIDANVAALADDSASNLWNC